MMVFGTSTSLDLDALAFGIAILRLGCPDRILERDPRNHTKLQKVCFLGCLKVVDYATHQDLEAK